MMTDCMAHAAQVKSDEAAATEKDAGAGGSTEGAEKHRFQVTEYDLRRCSSCAELFVQRRARQQDHGTNSRVVDATRSSSAHKQIAHGSTRARYANVTFCMECHTRHWQSTCNEEVPDRLRYHPLLHFFHLCLRQTRVTSTCFSYRQSNVTREDWTAGVQQFDCKPLTQRCKQQKPTQQLQPKDRGARWPSSSLT